MFAILVALVSCSAVYMDVDGTLVRSLRAPDSIAVSCRLAWWTAAVSSGAKQPLRWQGVAIMLLAWLLGKPIVIWTNRAQALEPATRAQLGWLMLLVSDVRFYAGAKLGTAPAGVCVVDDEAKYLTSRYGIHA